MKIMKLMNKIFMKLFLKLFKMKIKKFKVLQNFQNICSNYQKIYFNKIFNINKHLKIMNLYFKTNVNRIYY